MNFSQGISRGNLSGVGTGQQGPHQEWLAHLNLNKFRRALDEQRYVEIAARTVRIESELPVFL
jgi:hypothetical protein